MEGFKLTSASATAEEALKAADELEQAVGEICNGKRRAGNVPVEQMAVLVQFVRDTVTMQQAKPAAALHIVGFEGGGVTIQRVGDTSKLVDAIAVTLAKGGAA